MCVLHETVSFFVQVKPAQSLHSCVGCCSITKALFLAKLIGWVVVPYNLVYPSHVLYRYIEHFVICVVCLSANAMWIIVIVPCTSKHTYMNNRHSHVRWSYSPHTHMNDWRSHVRWSHSQHTHINDRRSHVRWSHSQHSTLVRIRYAHTTCQIIVTKDPTARQYRLDWASRARNVHTNKYSTIS